MLLRGKPIMWDLISDKKFPALDPHTVVHSRIVLFGEEVD